MADGIGHQWITYTTVPLHSMIVDCFTCEELIGGPEAHAGVDGVLGCEDEQQPGMGGGDERGRGISTELLVRTLL